LCGWAAVTRAQAHAKLQYDFPLVSPEALAALQAALAAGGTAPLREFPITAQLLDAVEDGARSREHGVVASGPRGASAPPPASAVVQRAFQLLAGTLFGSALRQLVLADDERADALLGKLCLAPAVADETNEAAMPHVAAPLLVDAPETLADGAGSSSDSDWEPLQCGPPFGADFGPGAEAVDGAAALPLAQRVDAKLSSFGARLRYGLLDLPGVWDALDLSNTLLGVLQALRARPRPCASRLRQCVARALCDRWMRRLDSTLPEVMRLLAEDAASGDEQEAALPLWLLGCLTARLGSCADAQHAAASGDPGALWSLVHACMGSVVAPRAEQLAAATRGAHSTAVADVLSQADAVGDVVAFYVLQAPAGVDAGSALLASGVIRSLVVLLPAAAGSLTSTALRRAALMACAAAPAVAAYAAAVPALGAAMQHAGEGDALGALWLVVHAAPRARGAATQPVCTLLASATAEVAAGAPPAAAALEMLLLLANMMRAAGAARPLWLPDGEIGVALRALRQALLSRSTAHVTAIGVAATEAAIEPGDGAVTEPNGAVVPVTGADITPPLSASAAHADSDLSKLQKRCAALLRAVKDVLALAQSGEPSKMD
jgi:hypothetical protein